MIVTSEREREREAETQAEGEAGRLHAPGARRGIRSRVSRIAPWAKGRRQTAAPPRDPKRKAFKYRNFKCPLQGPIEKPNIIQRRPEEK